MNIAVIGMSSFGFYLCQYLYGKTDVQIMAIDCDEEAIHRVKPYAHKAIIADAKNKDTLKKLGLAEFDRVILSLGEPIETSVLITLYLKEFGAKNIIAKAITEDHSKILTQLGATSIIFPEKEMAKRVAHTLCRKNLFDYFSLGSSLDDDYSVIEIVPPHSWCGKSLAEIEVRKKYNVQVIMIKEIVPANVVLIPEANYIVKDSDVLVLLGKDKNLEKIEKL
ncbi:MAG: TrkA family potassium uptake protein [Planctomycetota bacterium]